MKTPALLKSSLARGTSVFFLAVSPCTASELAHASDRLEPFVLPLQPAPSHLDATLGCAADHPAAAARLKDPATGGGVFVPYRSSRTVDYLSPSWPNEVASTWGFFDEKTTGEPPGTYRIVVIDVKTVNGVPHYHYFGNATSSDPTHLLPRENWSATKVLAAALAFHRMRLESAGRIGGDSTRSPGVRMVDDMDELNRLSSNELGGLYKALAGRQMSTHMITHWLLRPNETFGGFYGDPTWNTDGSLEISSESSGTTQNFDLRNEGSSDNTLSPLTVAEFMKRLGVGFRDPRLLPRYLDYSQTPSTAGQVQAPGPTLKAQDLKTLLYGNLEDGVGGMMYDGLRELPQNLGGSAHLDDVSHGRWRAFAKAGFGYSSRRLVQEQTLVGYVCIPEFNGGIEFAFFAHLQGKQGERTGDRLQAALGKTFRALYPALYANETDRP